MGLVLQAKEAAFPRKLPWPVARGQKWRLLAQGQLNSGLATQEMGTETAREEGL